MSLIAEAFVRLRPDLSVFAAETRAGVLATLGGIKDTAVRVHADAAPFRAEVATAVSTGIKDTAIRLHADVAPFRAEVATAVSTGIRDTAVRVHADATPYRAEIATALSTGIKDTAVRVHADLGPYRAEAVAGAQAAVAGITPTIRVHADPSPFRAEVATAVRTGIKDTAVRVHADLTPLRTEIVAGATAAVAGVVPTIPVHANTTAFRTEVAAAAASVSTIGVGGLGQLSTAALGAQAELSGVASAATAAGTATTAATRTMATGLAGLAGSTAETQAGFLAIERIAAQTAGVTVAATRQMASGLLVVEAEALRAAAAVSSVGIAGSLASVKDTVIRVHANTAPYLAEVASGVAAGVRDTAIRVHVDLASYRAEAIVGAAEAVRRVTPTIQVHADMRAFRAEVAAGARAVDAIGTGDLGGLRTAAIGARAELAGIATAASAAGTATVSATRGMATGLTQAGTATVGIRTGLLSIEREAATAAGITLSATREMASGLLVVEGQAFRSAAAVGSIGPAAARGAAQAASAAAATAAATDAQAASTTRAASAAAAANAATAGLGRGSIRAVAGMAGLTTAAVAVGLALKEVLIGGGQFERELDVLAVVSNATAGEMAEISERAKELGADITLPGISAGDAAASMNELAKAGLSVTDTMEGAKGALQLATAGEIAVGEAAALAGSALNVFGLQGDQASHVADLLAGASIAAQGEVTDMAQALQQAGTVSAQAGLSIEQTVGAISLLAKNGLLGSDAGTSLRTTLLRLIPTTKEAQDFTDALGISIDQTRSLGEQLPSVLDQYRDALSKLDPVVRQQALTQIFGSDAIRGATILFSEGAAGLGEMTRAVDRQGAANDLATARTKGFLGTLEGLGSQLQTTAVLISEGLLPPLTSFAGALSGVVGGINDLIGAIRDLKATPLPDIFGKDVFGPGTIGDPALGPRIAEGLGTLFDAIDRGGLDSKDSFNQMVQGADGALMAAEKIRDRPINLTDALEFDQQDANQKGKDLGDAAAIGIQQGIVDSAQLAVQAARQTLAQVARQGREAVQQAIVSAQQNLASLGSTLTGDAAAVIDASGVTERIDQITRDAARVQSAEQRSRLREAVEEARANLEEAVRSAPIERQIQRLQDRLDRASRTDDRRDIARTLRDAQEALSAAREQAQTTGALTGAQTVGRERFLRPFVEAVQDARGEVRDFNTEASIERLQTRLDGQTSEIAENIGRLRTALADARKALVDSQKEFATDRLVESLQRAAAAQKEAVAQGVNNAISEFNRGLISLPELNRRIANTLAANGVDYRKAGGRLGSAFVNGFEAALAGLSAQAKAILAGPQDAGAGIRADVVRPADAVRDAGQANVAARRALDEAMLKSEDDQTALLRQIRDAVGRGRFQVGLKPTAAQLERNR